MKNPLCILKSGSVINLYPGILGVYIIGGWNVRLNELQIKLTNVKNGDDIKVKYSRLPIQAFKFRRRALKIGTVDIDKWADYKIGFLNPNSLIVKPYNLFLLNFIQSEIPPNKIELYIG